MSNDRFDNDDIGKSPIRTEPSSLSSILLLNDDGNTRYQRQNDLKCDDNIVDDMNTSSQFPSHKHVTYSYAYQLYKGNALIWFPKFFHKHFNFVPLSGPFNDLPANLCVWFSLFVPTIAYTVIISPKLWEVSPVLPIVIGLTFIITVFLLILTQFTDPGYIPPSTINVLPPEDGYDVEDSYDSDYEPYSAPPSLPHQNPDLLDVSSLQDDTNIPQECQNKEYQNNEYQNNSSSGSVTLNSPNHTQFPSQSPATPSNNQYNHANSYQSHTSSQYSSQYSPRYPHDNQYQSQHPHQYSHSPHSPHSPPNQQNNNNIVDLPPWVDHTVDGVTARWRWCSSCNIYRPPRASHCSDCNMCVKEFDHHCPFVGSCVGQRNYFYFLAFITAVMVYITICIVSVGVVVVNEDGNDEAVRIVTIVISVIGGIFSIGVLSLCGMHIYLFCLGKTTKELLGKRRDNEAEAVEAAVLYMKFLNEDLIRGGNGRVNTSRTYLLNRPDSLLLKKLSHE